MDERLQNLTRALAGQADANDRSGRWPEAGIDHFRRIGGFGWSVPEAYGGAPLPPVERLGVYEALARGDMSTALFITQHDGAVDLIADSDNEPLKRAVLPRHAAGAALTTIGYAQLTTSHQNGAPALRAALEADEVILEGFIPWVTGALRVESVLTGAVLGDGRQLLALLPLDARGVEIEPPGPLLALDASLTSRVLCHGVRLPVRQLTAGPLPNVLARRSALRRLTVAACGIGLLAAMADRLGALEGSEAEGAEGAAAAVSRSHAELRGELHRVGAEAEPPGEEIDGLRIRVNDLLVRAAGVSLTLAKGSGFRREHPAQRLAREALFFCVWSAPEAIRSGTVARLLSAEAGL